MVKKTTTKTNCTNRKEMNKTVLRVNDRGVRGSNLHDETRCNRKLSNCKWTFSLLLGWLTPVFIVDYLIGLHQISDRNFY